MPGVLFFSSNPQRMLAHAYIRLMRFGVVAADFRNRGTPTLNREFKGPITSQIRAARTYFRDSGFFKRFQKRNPDGGFIEEPELPPVAIDEAIVNAVAHRDYCSKLPTECEAYLDAFLVKNPGRVIQRNIDLPDRFRLDTTHLDSTPRNGKLLEWLKLMRDPDGKGAERTFSTKFSYTTVVTATSVRDIETEIDRLLKQNPDWCGNKELNRLFLVQCPEEGFASDDELSPYYVAKRRLLEAGVPCQMVNTPTLVNPDWKDLNLALNVIAKCGVTPWVLPERIPDADFFIGLSYTQSRGGQRIMGFANVFNNYGRWVFYAGNTTTFESSKRSDHLAALVKETLDRLRQTHSLPASSNLVIHHSVRISREDRTAILRAARSVVPEVSLTFVWINSHGNTRLFDTRPETDGSARRGSYVSLSRRTVLLSTTGTNPYRKAMGTPRPLELSVMHFAARKDEPSDYDRRSLALQVLSLTKLNWASTDAFCGEPITVKYASDIAYLTAAFLRQREPFTLHPALESTPWFI